MNGVSLRCQRVRVEEDIEGGGEGGEGEAGEGEEAERNRRTRDDVWRRTMDERAAEVDVGRNIVTTRYRSVCGVVCVEFGE